MSLPPESSPRLPPNLRVYAIGDVHGRADLLEKMLRMIEADHLGYQGESLVIFIGDYVDRGPNSREVLDILTRYRGRLRVLTLRGNHEDILLRFFQDHSVAPGWFHYGGLQTLRSYGIAIPNATQDFDEIFHLQRRLNDIMPKEHRTFLENLGYTARYGDYFFVHAGIHPDIPLESQTPHHYMWIREPFLSSMKDFGFTVVHGHSIRMNPEIRSNRIGIDTGAYATGRLTCLVLQDADQRFLTT
ncbi:MAG: serine/threonine protein phosphatase [Proteobacteria bacterium]|nr:serine/threonine protein phosphatase [Pseudomonadota bacterium]